jgi:hypothetical protein
MQNFPEMDLIAWDQLDDDYNHTEQADNWAKVNLHDHAPGHGVQIPTDGLEDGAVTSAKIAAGAVTFDRLNTDVTGSLAGAGVFRAHKDLTDPDGAIPFSVSTPVICGEEEFDVDGWFDPVTGRYTPQIPGIYVFHLQISWSNQADRDEYDYCRTMLFKNGSVVQSAGQGPVMPWQAPASGGVSPTTGGSVLAQANGTTDYFQLGAYWSANSPNTHAGGDTMSLGGYFTFFSGYLVRGV